jgi:hypothetical protein
MRLIQTVENSPQDSQVWEGDVPAGKRSRVLFPVVEGARALVFLDLRPDGSVVCGLAKRVMTVAHTARRRASMEPLPAKILATLDDTPMPAGGHLTFHASGVVNSPVGARTYRAPLGSSAPHQLCVFRIEHPKTFPLVAPRKSDIILPGPLDTTYAIELKLTVPPEDTVVFYTDVPWQTVIRLAGRKGDQLVQTLQLSLLGTRRPWPNETRIEYVSQDPTVQGFSG